ncbi:MAG: DUF1599 domain-containing protein [Alloprevotella sp.]|nr:DUF1599 domain-containing protein [Alloprevotella sp.]
MKTEEEFQNVLDNCRQLFEKKLHDYNTAWRILRPMSLCDQLLIKVRRCRTLETQEEHLVDEGIVSEYIGIVNYSIMGLIQLSLGYADSADISNEKALEQYDKCAAATMELMIRKNHDYGEAWRDMETTSYTDLILMKILRTKQILQLGGQTLVSEGVDANFQDMINYAIFGLIKFTIENN